MKIRYLFSANAIIFISLGIAFALYGPLMINFLGIMEYEGNAVLYWYAASFARLYGAALFGFGFLLWAVRGIAENETTSPETRRGIVLAALLGCVIGLIVSITQQVSVWGTFISWGLVLIYAIVCLGYIYYLITGKT